MLSIEEFKKQYYSKRDNTNASSNSQNIQIRQRIRQVMKEVEEARNQYRLQYMRVSF